MRDPHEGLTTDGCIRTGASRDRVPPAFEQVVLDATSAFDDFRRREAIDTDAAMLLYGSVATGMAEPGRSDVDLVAIGVEKELAAALSRELSHAHRSVCREVAIAVAGRHDHEGPGDEAYGNRVFLRHYCVPLLGHSPVGDDRFPGDARAARGFNGDIRHALDRWRQADTTDAAALGRRIGRKTLLATAGLVSVAEGTWSTDRATAAARWRRYRPDLAGGLDQLLAWCDGASASANDVRDAVADDGVVSRIAEDFADRIGLWRT